MIEEVRVVGGPPPDATFDESDRCGDGRAPPEGPGPSSPLCACACVFPKDAAAGGAGTGGGGGRGDAFPDSFEDSLAADDRRDDDDFDDVWYYSRFRSLTDTVRTGLSDRTEDEDGVSIGPSIGGRTSSLSLFPLDSSHPSSHLGSSTDLSCSCRSCESSLVVQTLPHEPPGDPARAAEEEEDRRRSNLPVEEEKRPSRSLAELSSLRVRAAPSDAPRDPPPAEETRQGLPPAAGSNPAADLAESFAEADDGHLRDDQGNVVARVGDEGRGSRPVARDRVARDRCAGRAVEEDEDDDDDDGASLPRVSTYLSECGQEVELASLAGWHGRRAGDPRGGDDDVRPEFRRGEAVELVPAPGTVAIATLRSASDGKAPSAAQSRTTTTAKAGAKGAKETRSSSFPLAGLFKKKKRSLVPADKPANKPPQGILLQPKYVTRVRPVVDGGSKAGVGGGGNAVAAVRNRDGQDAARRRGSSSSDESPTGQSHGVEERAGEDGSSSVVTVAVGDDPPEAAARSTDDAPPATPPVVIDVGDAWERAADATYRAVTTRFWEVLGDDVLAVGDLLWGADAGDAADGDGRGGDGSRPPAGDRATGGGGADEGRGASAGSLGDGFAKHGARRRAERAGGATDVDGRGANRAEDANGIRHRSTPEDKGGTGNLNGTGAEMDRCLRANEPLGQGIIEVGSGEGDRTWAVGSPRYKAQEQEAMAEAAAEAAVAAVAAMEDDATTSSQAQRLKLPKKFGLRIPLLKRKKRIDDVIGDDFLADILDEISRMGTMSMREIESPGSCGSDYDLPQNFSDLVATAIAEEEIVTCPDADNLHRN